MAKTIEDLYGEEMSSTQTGNSDYDYLRKTAATEVLNAQLGYEQAHQLASKNLNSQLASAGLTGTGAQATAYSNLSNAYLQGMQSAQQQYANRLNDINLQEQTYNSDLSAANAETLLGYIGSSKNGYDLNKYLSQYGISSQGGKLVSDGSQGFTQAQLNALQNAYDESNISINSGLTLDEISQGGWDAQGGFGKNHDKSSIMGEYPSALRQLSNAEKAGKITDGTVIRLYSAHSEGDNLGSDYIVYRNGRYYRTDYEAYKNAANRTQFKN